MKGDTHTTDNYVYIVLLGKTKNWGYPIFRRRYSPFSTIFGIIKGRNNSKFRKKFKISQISWHLILKNISPDQIEKLYTIFPSLRIYHSFTMVEETFEIRSSETVQNDTNLLLRISFLRHGWRNFWNLTTWNSPEWFYFWKLHMQENVSSWTLPDHLR